MVAAVISEPIIEPIKTPWFQLSDSCTSGMVDGLLPPTSIADINTPSGSSHSFAKTGDSVASTVNLEFGCAAGVFIDGS